MRVLQAGARAPHRGRDRLHRLLLADDALGEFPLHAQELVLLAFEHAVDRHAGPARHHARHVIGGHGLLDHGALALGFGGLDRRELLFQFRNAAIGQFAGALVFALALRIGELGAQLVELGLELLRVRQLFLFRLPAAGDIGGFLFELFQFAFQALEAILGAGIAFLLQSLLLDLQPHDFAVDRIEFFRLGIDLHLEPRSRLVDQIDRLVGQEAVGDVAMRQGRRRDDRRIGDAHAVMLLVFVLQAAQDRDGILDRRLGHEHRLEASRQRGILLHVLLVFVERGGADAVQFAARQRRLEQIGGVHGAIGLAGADQRVHLVDEQNDAAVRGGDLVQHGLQPLLEFAAIFGAGDQRAEIEREQLLVLQALRHVAVDDAQRETLDNRGLADAGLADQHRIVLGAAREHLDGAADFLVAADHRIELAVACGLREIARIFLQRVIGVLGRRTIRGAPLAQRLDGGIEILRRHAGLAENLAGLAVLLQRKREQQALDGHETIAGFLAGLFGCGENAGGRRRQINLAGAGARHLRDLAERCLDRLQGLAGIAAGAIDQARRQPFRVVEQDLEQMVGGELLMALAQGQRLGGFHETAGTVGVLLEIHVSAPSAHDGAV